MTAKESKRAAAMNGARHTPGPWDVLTASKYGRFYIIAGAGQPLVAQVLARNAERIDEARANAELLAAAPVMLSALTLAAHVLAAVSEDPKDVLEFAALGALTEARAAIAAARGRA